MHKQLDRAASSAHLVPEAIVGLGQSTKANKTRIKSSLSTTCQLSCLTLQCSFGVRHFMSRKKHALFGVSPNRCQLHPHDSPPAFPVPVPLVVEQTSERIPKICMCYIDIHPQKSGVGVQLSHEPWLPSCSFGGFLKYGYPSHIPFLDGIFHEVNQPAIGGTSMTMETHLITH